MDLAHRFAHHPAEHLWEPVICGSEDSEDGRHSHDQMKMPDDEIRVVERNIERRLRQERTTQSARDKQRHEADREQHGREQTYTALVERSQPVEGFDRRGY